MYNNYYQWCCRGGGTPYFLLTIPLTLIKLHRSTEIRPCIRSDF